MAVSVTVDEEMAGLMGDEGAIPVGKAGDDPSQLSDSTGPQQVIMAEHLHPLVTTEPDGTANIVGLVEEFFRTAVADPRIPPSELCDNVRGSVSRAVIGHHDFRQFGPLRDSAG
jgi:hypothetical protein